MDKVENQGKFVIVGGGPVGMWIASQLKLRNPSIETVVFEKRTTYIREHILKLKKKYMSTPGLNNKQFEDLKKKIDGKVPTKLLEQELSTLASSHHVKIISGVAINSLEDIYQHVPEKEIIAVLGCDGRRSTIRTKIMKQHKAGDKLEAFASVWLPIMYPMNLENRIWGYKVLKQSPVIDEAQNMIKEDVFLHQLMLKYTIKGKGLPLGKMDHFKTIKLLKFPATEIVGKYIEASDTTEATCIFILDAETAESVKHFNPQVPAKFHDLHGSVSECVSIWMNAKSELVKQEIVTNSERILYVPISVYSACDFIDQSNSFPIALVGDAAYGVPYFKALNTGLQCGTKIAELLSELVQNKKKPNKKETFVKYQKFMGDKVYELYSQSKLKTKVFNFGIASLNFDKKSPFQLIKWSEGEFKQKLYRTFDPLCHENEHYTSTLANPNHMMEGLQDLEKHEHEEDIQEAQQ